MKSSVINLQMVGDFIYLICSTMPAGMMIELTNICVGWVRTINENYFGSFRAEVFVLFLDFPDMLYRHQFTLLVAYNMRIFQRDCILKLFLFVLKHLSTCAMCHQSMFFVVFMIPCFCHDRFSNSLLVLLGSFGIIQHIFLCINMFDHCIPTTLCVLVQLGISRSSNVHASNFYVKSSCESVGQQVHRSLGRSHFWRWIVVQRHELSAPASWPSIGT